MTSRRVLLSSLVAVALALGPAPARADELRLDPALDAAALGVGVTLAIALQVLVLSDELPPSAPGLVHDVNVLDRWVAQGSSAGTRTPDDLSDVLLGAAYVAAGLRPILTGLEQGTAAAWTDAVILAEALAWNGALAHLVRLAVRRPRPIAYIDAREGTFDPDETEATLSFYSGHTSTVATAAAALATIDFSRTPRGCPRPWVVLGAGAAATIATGALRVAARRHFVTDVTVGAIVGTGVGIMVPLLHRQTAGGPTPTLALLPGGGTAGVAGTW